jgi:AcrR family transcriptional regulator
LVVRGKKSSKLAILGQPRPTAERKDAQRNRQRILEAAKRLLRDRPIQQICMDELAQTAGVGKGTLYRRFEDRASLCRALLHEEATILQNRVLSGFDLPSTAPNLVFLAYLVDALFEFVADNASLLSEAIAFERSHAKRYEHPAHAWQRDTLIRYLERAIAAGEIEKTDCVVVSEMVLAALDPDLIQWHLGRGTDRNALRDSYRRSWMALIRGPQTCPSAY